MVTADAPSTRTLSEVDCDEKISDREIWLPPVGQSFGMKRTCASSLRTMPPGWSPVLPLRPNVTSRAGLRLLGKHRAAMRSVLGGWRRPSHKTVETSGRRKRSSESSSRTLCQDGFGQYATTIGRQTFFGLSARFGNNIYNFNGAFSPINPCTAENVRRTPPRLFPSNDIYLAFLSADITRSYFGVVGRLLWGMISSAWSRGSQARSATISEKSTTSEK
jgi:hypothetical protein